MTEQEIKFLRETNLSIFTPKVSTNPFEIVAQVSAMSWVETRRVLETVCTKELIACKEVMNHIHNFSQQHDLPLDQILLVEKGGSVDLLKTISDSVIRKDCVVGNVFEYETATTIKIRCLVVNIGTLENGSEVSNIDAYFVCRAFLVWWIDDSKNS